jgi:hypothetical protein
LGFICFPVDLIHLQVHKPASADLPFSQFTKDWGEIDSEFFFSDFLTQAHGFCHTQARIVRLSAFSLRFCLRIGAECASVHTVGRAFDSKFFVL